MFVFSCLSILGKSVLIVALAAGLLMQFFPCCAFAIRSFSKVSATPAQALFKQGNQQTKQIKGLVIGKALWQSLFCQESVKIIYRLSLLLFPLVYKDLSYVQMIFNS